MTATLTFRKAAIKGHTRESLQAGLVEAAEVLVRDIRQALNQPADIVVGPRGGVRVIGSSPGEYPRKRSGNLRKEIEYFEGELVVEVGATEGAQYWSDLEYGTVKMEARPVFRPRFAARKKDLEAIVGTRLKSFTGG
jgi:HK97 gp10 family phage protein